MADIPVYEKHYINGQWVGTLSEKKEFIDVFDSSLGTTYAKVVAGCEEDTNAAIEAAHDAFDSWSGMSLATRVEYIQKILQEYMKRKDRVAEALQRELGAPQALAHEQQAMLFPMHLSTVLKIAKDFEWTEDIGRSILVKEPIGVVGCITPWNWPTNQIGAKIGPALLAGCTVVLKPSEVTPVNAIIIAEAIHAAGLPPGVFNLVNGRGRETGQPLATHSKVSMVSFTGSTAVGRRLHALGASSIKRVRTELGGKSAAIVLDDASEKSIRMVARNVVGNTGQSCNALSRLLVPENRYEEVVNLVKETFESVRIVNATDPSAKMGDMGPLASKQQLDKVRGYIKKGVEEGARLVCGGTESPDDPELSPFGYFVLPTVFADVTNDMTIAREEIFGPVLCILKYKTEKEAISIANDTIYGLNNAVVSQDEKRAMNVALQLRSGQVQVNTLNGTPLTPFGGYKQSGDGREWGKYGLEEFLQVKAINIPKGHAKL